MSKHRINGLGLSSLFTLAAALLVVACATPGASAAVFDVYVVSNGRGDVYQIPSNFGGLNVVTDGAPVFASGYATGPSSGVYGIAAKGSGLYMAQANGNIFVKSVYSAPGGTGASFVNTGSTAYDLTFADGGNLHVVGGSGTTVKVFDPSGSPLTPPSYTITGGPADAGIDYAPGDGIYIAQGSHIQRLTGSGSSYTDATSIGLAGDTFSSPQFLQQIIKATDGNLYTADFASSGGKNIFRINPTTGAETTLFAIDGQLIIGATTYNGIAPAGLEEGPDGRLYFTDLHNNDVFSINLDGSVPEVLATNLSTPTAIAFLTPEPASLGFLAIGGVMLLRRRR